MTQHRGSGLCRTEHRASSFRLASERQLGRRGSGSPLPLRNTLWFLLGVVVRYIGINVGLGLSWLWREFLKNRDRW